MLGVFLKMFFFFERQRTNGFGGTAQRQVARGNSRPWWHQGSRADQRSFPNNRSAQQNRAHADQSAVSDATGMKDRAVSHGDVSTHDGGNPVIRVQNSVVLDIRIYTDDNPFNVAPQNRPRPDRGPARQPHTADHFRRRMDKRRLRHHRADTAERTDHDFRPRPPRNFLSTAFCT